MNLPETPLRIAIVQPAMQWNGDANTQSILDTIAQAAAGAWLCVFPELAVTRRWSIRRVSPNPRQAFSQAAVYVPSSACAGCAARR